MVHRGMGRQAQLMLFNLTGFWAVGVTTGYFLTFRFGWGLPGLWYGILAGVLAAGMACLLLLNSSQDCVIPWSAIPSISKGQGS